MLSRFITQPSSILSAADAARDHGDWSSAIQLYSKALLSHPDRTDLHVQLGHAYKESGQLDQAETEYHKFAEADPINIDIHIQLGHLYTVMRRNDDALRSYDKALDLAQFGTKIDSRLKSASLCLEIRAHRITPLLERSLWRDAKAELEYLVESGRDDLVGLLANVTKECGDFEAATLLYAKYRECAAKYAVSIQIDAEIQSGHMAKVLGDYRTALFHFLRARELVDSYPSNTVEESLADEIALCRWCIAPVFVPVTKSG